MLNVRYHIQFKKDYKLLKKSNYKIELLNDAIKKLVEGKKLEAKYKDHPLKGEYIGCREYHIQPDLLLIYEIDKKELVLYLTRTATHSDLFK